MREEVEKGETAEVSIVEAVAEAMMSADLFTDLTPGARKARASYRLVELKRLTEAVGHTLGGPRILGSGRRSEEAFHCFITLPENSFVDVVGFCSSMRKRARPIT